MPSVISHSIIGLAFGVAFAKRDIPKRFWILLIISGVVPDADMVGFAFGIHYADFWGHRGFFHSIFFAFAWSLLVLGVFFRSEERFSRQWWLLMILFFAVTSSHGILDAFTNGGLGVALLSPFDTTRYFFPWTPIHVSPFGMSFFSKWGLQVTLNEIMWIWSPAVFLVLLMRTLRSSRPDRHSAL